MYVYYHSGTSDLLSWSSEQDEAGGADSVGASALCVSL